MIHFLCGPLLLKKDCEMMHDKNIICTIGIMIIMQTIRVTKHSSYSGARGVLMA